MPPTASASVEGHHDALGFRLASIDRADSPHGWVHPRIDFVGNAGGGRQLAAQIGWLGVEAYRGVLPRSRRRHSRHGRHGRAYLRLITQERL